jgi:alpha-glucosidase (family GH31 glycosyl hydrolase)
MVRWVQFGVFSPIFRLHSDHGVREPWRFGRRALEIMRRFLRLRREMLPYLRRLAREAHETGVAPCRPMYYEFPDEEEAYRRPYQYMLGPDILVVPVTNPAGHASVWIPPGEWRNLLKDNNIIGDRIFEEVFELKRFPIFFRDKCKLEIKLE